MEKIAIIAGNGKFPLIVANEVRKRKQPLVILGIEKEAHPALMDNADRFYWVQLGKLKKLIEICKNENIKKAVMAGQVRHTHLFSSLKLDLKAISLLSKIKDKKADTILKAVADEFAINGIELINSTTYVKYLLPSPGVLTKLKPTKKQLEDIKFGYKIAKQIAQLDIGQTVVVKDKTVLAIESLEGTDNTILRGASLGGKNIVVIKVSKPNQDFRFDVPVIGIRTIETLKQIKAGLLCFTANKTLLLDKEKVIQEANKSNICIVSLKEDEKN